MLMWRSNRYVLRGFLVATSPRLLLGSVVGLLGFALEAASAKESKRAGSPSSSGALYATTNVLSAHFKFTPEHWKGLEPTRRENPMGFGAGGFNLQGKEGGRNGLSAAQGIEFHYVHADLQFNGEEVQDIAVRYKGNGTFMQSQGSAKRSLKVDVAEYVKGRKVSGVSKLNFHNCVTDPSFMNEVLSYRLYRDAGVPAPKTAFSRVYVTVPGSQDHAYLGLYSMVENVDGRFVEAHFGAQKGLLLKPVTPKPFEDLGDDWSKYKQTYDPKSEGSKEQTRRVIEFCKLVSNAPDADFAVKAPGYIDIDAFARYMAVTVYLSALDSILGIGQNYLVYLNPASNKFQFVPWDLDHSFGQFMMVGSQEQREQLSIAKPWQGEIKFLERIFKIETFQKAYRGALSEFAKTVFRPERFHQQVDELSAVLRSAIKEESPEKLERFEKVVAGETVTPAAMFGGGGPGGPGGPQGGREGGPRAVGPGAGQGRPQFGGNRMSFPPTKPIKPFVVARTRSIEQQLAGADSGKVIERMFGPGGRGGGGFGPGMFLAPAFIDAADKNGDRKITQPEFHALAEKWFGEWDKGQTGSLTDETLGAGLGNVFPAPPGFGGRGPGGPGGGFNPGRMLAGGFIASMDQDKNNAITQKEFVAGFDKWFASWDKKGSGVLDEEQVRSGLNQEFSPRGGAGGPGGPRGGSGGPGRPPGANAP